MSESTLVRQRPKQGRGPSAAEMQARIGVLETEPSAATTPCSERQRPLHTLSPSMGEGRGGGGAAEEDER